MDKPFVDIDKQLPFINTYPTMFLEVDNHVIDAPIMLEEILSVTILF